MVWIMLVGDRKKPLLSASMIATKTTSGRSNPSRNRLTPTRTSKSLHASAKNFQSFQSLHFGVQPPNPQVAAFEVPAQILGQAFRETVTIVRSPSPAIRGTLPPNLPLGPGPVELQPWDQASRWANDLFHHHAIGLLQFPWAGVADTCTTCGTSSSNSSNFRGRLSIAEGSLKP